MYTNTRLFFHVIRNAERTSNPYFRIHDPRSGQLFYAVQNNRAPCLTMYGKRVCLSRGKQRGLRGFLSCPNPAIAGQFDQGKPLFSKLNRQKAGHPCASVRVFRVFRGYSFLVPAAGQLIFMQGWGLLEICHQTSLRARRLSKPVPV